jgi:hypothetical protein
LQGNHGLPIDHRKGCSFKIFPFRQGFDWFNRQSFQMAMSMDASWLDF